MIRHKQRHIHASLVTFITAGLQADGWLDANAPFGATPVTIVDYQPEERGTAIAPNTVAISMGDQGTDDEWELGGRYGGLLSVEIPLFVDVYGERAAISLAIASDIKDRLRWAVLPVFDQVQAGFDNDPFNQTGFDTDVSAPGMTIEVDSVMGPEAPKVVDTAGQLKQHWRVLRARTVTYFQD